MDGNFAFSTQLADKFLLFKVAVLNGSPEESSTAEASVNAIVSQMTLVIEVLADWTITVVLVLKGTKRGSNCQLFEDVFPNALITTR